MTLQDLHVHTNFCDGKNTPEEMVQAAVKLGLEGIGLCVHSYTPFDESYCVKKERIGEYLRTVAALKEKYRGVIKVLCGVELDLYSDMPTDGFDYVIGSVHYLKNGEDYCPIDENVETLRKAVQRYYGGDWLAMCRAYYESVARLSSKRTDIVGHFDLVTKFNHKTPLFDENSRDYLSLAEAAVDALLPFRIPFEINTGGISRGYREVPYPAPPLLAYIRQRGGEVLPSSDAHCAAHIGYGFAR
ncbi:MAG: histidinol-phosphatase [Faecousia sp.]